MPIEDDVYAEITRELGEINLMPETTLHNIVHAIGVSYVESTYRNSNEICTGIDAIFSAIVFESWIVFESMASDLWVTAVDKGPKQIANTVAVSRDLKKPDDAITPKVLHELEYDARTQFGLFLRETRRVFFQKLNDIRSTYSIAFGEEASTLFKKTNGGRIMALSALRNVFAHKAGRADKDFTEQVKSFDDLRPIKRDEQIVLTPTLTRSMLDASAHMGLALIRFVDEYVTVYSN